MDEVGSRVRAAPPGQQPGFEVAPFMWSHDGAAELLSVMWPVEDVAEGAVVTRDPQLGMANYNSQAYW